MLQRIAVAGFATAGVILTLMSLLPTFRGGTLNVPGFTIGIACLILAMVLGAAFGRSGARK